MQRPRRDINIDDGNETHAPNPNPDEDVFHESIEQDNDVFIAHVTQFTS